MSEKKCPFCGSKNLQPILHLQDMNPTNVVALCNSCHKHILSKDYSENVQEIKKSLPNNTAILVDFSVIRGWLEGVDSPEQTKLLKLMSEIKKNTSKIRFITTISNVLHAIYTSNVEKIDIGKLKDMMTYFEIVQLSPETENVIMKFEFKNQKQIIDETILVANILAGEKK